MKIDLRYMSFCFVNCTEIILEDLINMYSKYWTYRYDELAEGIHVLPNQSTGVHLELEVQWTVTLVSILNY